MVHVVRRYGPVGGMERYVWETTQALASSGAEVSVLCEGLYAPAPDGIEVVQLGAIAPRPRWLSLMRFSWRAGRWLRATQAPGRIVHSHERLGVHDFTTFHGPPFATIFERGWWRCVSVRVAAQLWLERRELCAPQVRAVVPNSELIRAQLAQYYPCIGARMTAPVPPAVNPGPLRAWREVPRDGGTIGFVGKEWKRKGLDVAIRAAATLQRTRPGLELLIVGPEAQEIADLLSGSGVRARCAGWADSAAYYPQMDVLLHPARAEPYGMVIAEAMAARVPVVVSDRCGIAPEVKERTGGAVLPLDARPQEWAAACEAALSQTNPPPVYARAWSQVAQEYMSLYRSLLKGVRAL